MPVLTTPVPMVRRLAARLPRLLPLQVPLLLVVLLPLPLLLLPRVYGGLAEALASPSRCAPPPTS